MAVAVDPQTDDALLALMRAGDDAAFQALVDRHRPWLVRRCTRWLGHDAHAAEDVAQESLLKLHAAVRDGRPIRVRPWLTVVARNRCVDEQRRRRPDLPGELPERAAPGDDGFDLDTALSDAWSQLSGRHREVLYLREVLGFSYKEIGAVMDLSLAATETLVFRARAALRREYEKSGGTSFGCVLLGVHLARLGDNLRQGPGPSSRIAQLLTALPGCGEQALAKILSVAAGVVVAAASMTAGVGPFADAPAAQAATAPAVVTAATTVAANSLPVQPPAPARLEVGTLKTMLGDAVPADWTPKAAPTATTPAGAPAPAAARSSAAPDSALSVERPAPLREALAAAREEDRPRLRRSAGAEGEVGPVRTLLSQRPEPADWERPRPIRSLLEALPQLFDDAEEPLPNAPPPVSPPADEPPADPPPLEEIPAVRETVGGIVATFGDDDSIPLRLRDR